VPIRFRNRIDKCWTTAIDPQGSRPIIIGRAMRSVSWLSRRTRIIGEKKGLFTREEHRRGTWAS